MRLFSLKRSLSDIASARDDAQVISDEIHRLERIVNDFLQLARPSEPSFERVAVGTLLREAGALLEPQLAKRSVRLVVEDPPQAWLRADPRQLKQVLINLVDNGGQSIQGAGEVALRARTAAHALAGQMTETVEIEVADTGKGMSPEVVRRLFDPFFTTKENGTGLGLPIAARIVEQHGGVIEYETKVGRGTTFRLVLPRVPDYEELTQNTADRG